VTSDWYWDLNDATREFSARFATRFGGKVPTSLQADAYAAVYEFLAAADEAGTSSDGRRILAQLEKRPNYDPIFGVTSVRRDGRRMTPVYVFCVKDPTPERKFDVFQLVQTNPPDGAYRPLAEGHCDLIAAVQ
jgi:branched-chain amino acid transport system substrate-binding protein